MAETAIFILVVLALAQTVRAQWMSPTARSALLNELAIFPQWKFFGQSVIADDPALFDDLHLLARIEGDDEGWQELLFWDDRPWYALFWRPGDRFDFFIGQQMLSLRMGVARHDAVEPSSLPYLIVLRHCLDRLAPAPDMAIQFAVVGTGGRKARTVALHFLSDWHLP